MNENQRQWLPKRATLALLLVGAISGTKVEQRQTEGYNWYEEIMTQTAQDADYPGVRFLAQNDAATAEAVSQAQDGQDLMKDHWKWSEDYMRKVGAPTTYHDDSPAGYVEHLPFEGSRSAQAAEDVAKRAKELEQDLKEGTELSRKAAHASGTFPMDHQSHEFNFPNAEPGAQPTISHGMPGADKSQIHRSIFQSSSKQRVFKDKEHFISGKVSFGQSNQERLYQVMEDQEEDLETLAQHRRASSANYEDDDFEDIEARNQISSYAEQQQVERPQSSDEDDLIQQQSTLESEKTKKAGISAELMTMSEALKKYYRVETHSRIMPYIVREDAWSSDELDAMNTTRYCSSAPDGYSVDLDCTPKSDAANSTNSTGKANATSGKNATLTNSSSDATTDSSNNATSDADSVEATDAWENKLVNRTWEFGLSPSKVNETIKFKSDKTFKLNASAIEGQWTLNAGANETKIVLYYNSENATLKLKNESRPYVFRPVSGKAPLWMKNATIREHKLSNSTSSNVTAPTPSIVANASQLNKTLTAKRWFLAQSTDDLRRELKFFDNNMFMDLSGTNMFGRWEIDQNGTTAQVTLRFSANGDKVVYQANQTKPFNRLNVLRTERNSLLKSILFEMPPGSKVPGPSNSTESSGGEPVRSLNQTIQAMENAMSLNSWYYSKDVKDYNYPLKFNKGDKTWKALNEKSIHGTWNISKDVSVIQLRITFDNKDYAVFDLTGFNPLVFKHHQSTRYGMVGYKIYTEENPVSTDGKDEGNDIGDMVDSLESLMVGKSWVAGHSALNSSVAYRFYNNHTYAKAPYDDIDGKWTLQNNGSANILTMTQISEVGNGSIIEHGSTKYEMVEGNDVIQFGAFESDWGQRRDWVLTENDTVSSSTKVFRENTILLGKDFHFGNSSDNKTNEYKFHLNMTFTSKSDGNGTWNLQITKGKTNLHLNYTNVTGVNTTQLEMRQSSKQMKFEVVEHTGRPYMANWTLFEDGNKTKEKLNKKASAAEEGIMTKNEWFAGELETDTEHPWKFHANKTFITKGDGNTGNWTLVKVGKLMHLKMKWENGGKATFELKQGKSSGIVKFACFASNFKHMRSWKLWQKTSAADAVKSSPFDDIFVNNTWFMGETQGLVMKKMQFHANKTWVINATNATANSTSHITAHNGSVTGNWSIDSLSGDHLKLLLTINGSTGVNVSRVEYTMQPSPTGYLLKETKSVLKNASDSTVEDFIAKRDTLIWARDKNTTNATAPTSGANIAPIGRDYCNDGLSGKPNEWMTGHTHTMLLNDAWSFGPNLDTSRAEPDIIFHANQTFALSGIAGSSKGTWSLTYITSCSTTVLNLKFAGGAAEMDWTSGYTQSSMVFKEGYSTIPYMNGWRMWNNPKMD